MHAMVLAASDVSAALTKSDAAQAGIQVHAAAFLPQGAGDVLSRSRSGQIAGAAVLLL